MTSDSVEKKGISKENPPEETGFFLIKSIRQYPDPYVFWRHEATSLTLTDDTPDYEKNRPLRFGGEKKPYTLRIDGPQKVKDRPLYKKYDENQKKWNYSKHKSLTAVKKQGLCPPAFSFNEPHPDNVEVGYMLPAKPEYALERRILQNKGGTLHRNFRFETEKEAKDAWVQGLKDNKIFPSLDKLAKHGDPKRFNEVMAHVKWGPEARIAYCKDNLNSRLRAISLAHDMSVRLQEQKIKGKGVEESKSTSSKELPQVKICSYLPTADNKSANIQPYILGAQEQDISSGLESKDLKTRAFARFIQLQKNDFVKKEEDEYTAEELEIFIKIAADLTYESSILFFQNFFKNQESIFKKLLDEKPHLLREIFRCVPLDKRSELIYPLLTTPESRGYYLHCLLKFDCLEHDIEEFFKQLESGGKINFEVLGQYKPDNRKWKIVEVQDRNENTPLHLAVARNNIQAAELLLDNGASIHAQNKDDKTPLRLAHEARQPYMAAILLLKGGITRSLVEFFHSAVKAGNCDLVKFLIGREPSIVNNKDNNGLAAVYHAISNNNFSMLELLLGNGAKVEIGMPNCALAQDRLEMAKLLIEKGIDVNEFDYSWSWKSALGWAISENKLVAADLLLSHGGTYLSKSDDKVNTLLDAIKNKNWAVIDFLLARENISFLSLVSDTCKNNIGSILVIDILLGTAYGVYKGVNPSLSEDMGALIDALSMVMLIVLVGWNLFLLSHNLCLFNSAKKNYDALQERVEDKKTVLAKTNLLQKLGVSEPSVEGVIRHFDSLSLDKQAETLMKIAEIDDKLSLYVIIRLFNSNVERASNILWEVSLLPENTREKFCDLFENSSSDELEVIAGCVTQKIKAEMKGHAYDILKMFSVPTQNKILEKLDPNCQKLIKEYFTAISNQQQQKIDSPSDQIIEVSDHKQHSPTLGRGTFFHHSPTQDVKDAKKSPEFVWKSRVTQEFLVGIINAQGAEEGCSYLQRHGLDEENARAHVKWLCVQYESQIRPEKMDSFVPVQQQGSTI